MLLSNCTLATELTACAFPLACFEPPSGKDGAASYCACLSSYAYSGPMCDERTASTEVYIGWLAFMLAVSGVAVLWAHGPFMASLYAKWRVATTQITTVAALAHVGHVVHVAYLGLCLADALQAETVDDVKEGMRVTKLWKFTFYMLVCDVFVALMLIMMISACWAQLAYRSDNLRHVHRRDAKLIQRTAVTCAAIVFFVSIALFAGGARQGVFIFWAITGLLSLMLWTLGSVYIGRVLQKMSSSGDQEFARTLHEVQRTAVFTGAAVVCMIVGWLLQASTAATVAAGHELAPMHTGPPWIVGIAMVQFGLHLLYSTVLVFARDRLLGSKKARSNSKDTVVTSAAAAAATTGGAAGTAPPRTPHLSPQQMSSSSAAESPAALAKQQFVVVPPLESPS